MSLDITSHPVRSGPDELVPSRYALRVLTACWVRAERDDGMRLNNWSIAASYDTARSSPA